MEISNLYKSTFGIETTIETDKHGNPSVQDFIDAFKKAKSNKVILIVDDGNYMLAAKETIELLPKTMHVELLRAETVASSYLLCLAYNPHET
jgi:dihydroxyacetone kinase-like predicted kinase